MPKELDAPIAAFNGMLGCLERGFTQLKQVCAEMAHDVRVWALAGLRLLLSRGPRLGLWGVRSASALWRSHALFHE